MGAANEARLAARLQGDDAARAVDLTHKVIDPRFFGGSAGVYLLRFPDRGGAGLSFQVADGRVDVHAEEHASPALTVSLAFDAFTRLVTGQLELHELLRSTSHGGLTIEGDETMVQPLVESLRAALPSSKVNLTPVEMDRVRQATAPVRKPIEIDRRGRLTADEFMAEYAYPGRPVVLTDMMREWKIDGMTPSRLRDLIGDVRTKAIVHGDPTLYEPLIGEHIDALQKAAADGTEETVKYAQMELPPEVARRLELVPPPYFERKHYVLPRMWLGGRGATTPIHYDDIDNFLAQVFGEKIVTLYHPDEADLIDPDHQRFVYTFDPERIDPIKHRLARHANPIRVVLGPGEVLFNPGMWYHHVVVSKGPSLSINFFVGRALPATLWQR